MFGCPICMNRRRMLSGAAALGAAALAGCSPRGGGASSSADPAPTLVDVHFHAGSPMIAKLQSEHSGTTRTAPTAKELVAMMDANGCAVGVCSAASTWELTDDLEVIRDANRDANEHFAKMKSDYPTRFGMLTALPMPDVDATLKEIEYAFDTLGAGAVHMHTNYGGHWLGEPFFDPVLEELNRRKAVMKTHPAIGAWARIPYFNDYGGTAITELGTDTMRAMDVWLFGGAAQKYPNIKVVWSHCGGALLGQLQRFVNNYNSGKFNDELPDGPEAVLKAHYYDTAQSYSAVTLRALKRFVANSQIMFGTDWPLALSIKDSMDAIAKTQVFTDDECAAWAANARTLFNLPPAAA